MSGAQYSGPKGGIPPGPQGPAFRALEDPTGPGYGPRMADAFARNHPEFSDLLLREGDPGSISKQDARDDWLARMSPSKPIVVYNADEFLSGLPPQGLTLFHRMWTFEGTTVVSAGVSSVRDLFTLDPGESLIATVLQQVWFQSANEPLAPDALQPFPRWWNANGEMSFELLVNDSAVFNAQENLSDPEGAGPAVQRNAPGFTQLGVNLLDFGLLPTAAYLIEGRVQARFNLQQAPTVIPSSMGVVLKGFLAPTKTVYETLIDVRRQQRAGP